MSIQELLGLGKTQHCTYLLTDQKGVTSGGDVFLSGGKMRGDFHVQTGESKTNTGSMINDGAYIYTWSPSTKQGLKIPITETVQKSIQDAQINPGQYMDLNKKIDYKCSDWQVDSAMFTPPKEIKFMDFSEQMKQVESIKKGIGDMKASPCAACDSLQGTAKDSCKTALKCP